MLKKIVFTVEQDVKNHQKLSEETSVKEDEQQLQGLLPNLQTPGETMQQTQTLQKQNLQAKAQLNKVTLKRLNYISHTLDGYDPVKKKMLFRNNVEKQKNQRIWELWRQDLNDKNSVKDIAIKVDQQHKGGRSMQHYEQMLNQFQEKRLLNTSSEEHHLAQSVMGNTRYNSVYGSPMVQNDHEASQQLRGQMNSTLVQSGNLKQILSNDLDKIKVNHSFDGGDYRQHVRNMSM